MDKANSNIAPYEVLTPKNYYKDPIDWATVTQEELSRRASIFSFELVDARKRLAAGPNWVKFIVAHLYVDHILSQFLADNFVNPDAFSGKSRRKYVLDKLEICDAMGWIDPDLVRICKKLNSIRNSLAHSLSFTIDKKTISIFIGLFPNSMKMALVTEDKEDGPYPKSLQSHMELVLVLLDINRQNVLRAKYSEQRSKRDLKKAMLNAKRVLEETGSRS